MLFFNSAAVHVTVTSSEAFAAALYIVPLVHVSLTDAPQPMMPQLPCELSVQVYVRVITSSSAAFNSQAGSVVSYLLVSFVAITVSVVPGFTVGATVGVAVGATVGVAVGATVGFTVGVAVGFTVGVAVGATVGVAVGFTVGVAVGATVGVAVGFTVGATVGVAVGATVGATVGVAVGSTVLPPLIPLMEKFIFTVFVPW